MHGVKADDYQRGYRPLTEDDASEEEEPLEVRTAQGLYREEDKKRQDDEE